MSSDRDSQATDHPQKGEIELIDACHPFPGPFALSVIARNDDQVTEALLATIETRGQGAEGESPRSPLRHDRQPSAGDKYVSHRLEVHCANAVEAHTLRAALRAVDGVITVL